MKRTFEEQEGWKKVINKGRKTSNTRRKQIVVSNKEEKATESEPELTALFSSEEVIKEKVSNGEKMIK